MRYLGADGCSGEVRVGTVLPAVVVTAADVAVLAAVLAAAGPTVAVLDVGCESCKAAADVDTSLTDRMADDADDVPEDEAVVATVRGAIGGGGTTLA